MLKFPVKTVKLCPYCGKAALKPQLGYYRCDACLKYITPAYKYDELPDFCMELLFRVDIKTLDIEFGNPLEVREDRRYVYASSYKDAKDIIDRELERIAGTVYQRLNDLCESIWEEEKC